MSTNLLSIPQRKSENVPLNQTINSIIKREYFQSPEVFKDNIESVADLRDDVVILANEQNNSTASTENIVLLKRQVFP